MSVLNRPMFRRQPVSSKGTGITAYFAEGGPVVKGTPSVYDPAKFDPQNVQTFFRALENLYAPLMDKQRSMQELIAERANILGPLDNEVAFNTALARAGAAISKAGSLAAGLAPAAQAFTETSAEGEEKNRLLQRQVALSALDQMTKEKETAKQAKMSILGAAINQEESRIAAVLAEKKRLAEIEAEQNYEMIRDNIKRIYDEQSKLDERANDNFQKALDRASQKELKGLDIEAENKKIATNLINHFMKEESVTFIKPNDMGSPSKGFTILGEYKQTVTPEGTVEWRNIFNNSSLPAGSLKFDAQVASVFTPKFDAPKKAFIPDTTHFTGLRPIQYQTDRNGTPFMLVEENGEKVPMPQNAIISDQTEMFKTEILPNGSTAYTITNGPFAGKTVIVDRAGKIQNLSEIADVYTGDQLKRPSPADAAVPDAVPDAAQDAAVPDAVPDAAQDAAAQGTAVPDVVQNNPTSKFLTKPLDGTVVSALRDKENDLKNRNPAIGEITGRGAELHILSVQPASSIKSFDLDPTTARETERNIIAYEEFLAALDDVINAGAANSVGIAAKLRSIITNGIDPLIYGNDWAFVADEKNRALLELMTNKMITALAVNDERISVDEQNRIRSIAPSVQEWFVSPASVTARLAEIIRHSKNNLSLARSRLTDKPALLLQQVPQGTVRDPFTPKFLPYVQALNAEGFGDDLRRKFFKDAKGRVLRIQLNEPKPDFKQK